MSRRVLLLNPPGSRVYLRDYYCSHVSKGLYCWEPLELLALTGTLGDAFELTVIDAIAERLPVERCLGAIEAGCFEAVVFLTGASSWREDMELLRRVREASPALLVGSGDVLLFETARFLDDFPFLDAVLTDFTGHELAAFLAKPDGGPFRGLAVRGRETPVPAQAAEFSMGVPRHDLFPLGRYHLPHLKRHPFASVLTAFGCPHRCTFCAFERLPFRRRDPAEMEEELRRLAEMGVGELFLRDMTFGADRAHAERCLELLERRSFSWSCESRADTVDAAFLSRMKSAGCHTVMFGVESGSDEILRGCGKGLTTARLREAFALCRAAGIRTLAHFCLGLPGESEETFSKTMAFAAELDPDYATFNSAAPRLGTTLREQAVREGWMSDALEEYDPSRLLPLMSLPGLPRERAHAMRAEASRAFYLRPRWLLRRALGARTLHEALTLLREGAHLLRGL